MYRTVSRTQSVPKIKCTETNVTRRTAQMSAVWTQKNPFSDEMQLKHVDSFEFLFLAPTIISF